MNPSVEPTLFQAKSRIVSVIGWMLVALAGIMIFITGIQLVAVSSAPDWTKFDKASISQDTPLLLKFIMQNFSLFLSGIILYYWAVLLSSIGLLKRKEWARKSTVFLLGFYFLFSIAGFVQTAPSFFSGQAYAAHEIKMILAVSVLFSSVSLIFVAWVIYKLTRPAVKAQFK